MNPRSPAAGRVPREDYARRAASPAPARCQPGRPVYQLLGGAFRKQFLASASNLFGDTPAETERAARALAGQGYRAVKFGWGPMGQSEESDLAHVRAARQGLGPDVELMVDAG